MSALPILVKMVVYAIIMTVVIGVTVLVLATKEALADKVSDITKYYANSFAIKQT